MENDKSKFERNYDVCLSFAGEDREHAETLARLIKNTTSKFFTIIFRDPHCGEGIYISTCKQSIEIKLSIASFLYQKIT